MRTKEIKLYQFNELDDDAKETAVEQFADINIEYEWWVYQIDWFIEKFDEIGGEFRVDHRYNNSTKKEPIYSFDLHHGGGFEFDGSLDVLTWLKSQKLCNKYRSLYYWLNDGFTAVATIKGGCIVNIDHDIWIGMKESLTQPMTS